MTHSSTPACTYRNGRPTPLRPHHVPPPRFRRAAAAKSRAVTCCHRVDEPLDPVLLPAGPFTPHPLQSRRLEPAGGHERSLCRQPPSCRVGVGAAAARVATGETRCHAAAPPPSLDPYLLPPRSQPRSPTKHYTRVHCIHTRTHTDSVAVAIGNRRELVPVHMIVT